MQVAHPTRQPFSTLGALERVHYRDLLARLERKKV